MMRQFYSGLLVALISIGVRTVCVCAGRGEAGVAGTLGERVSVDLGWHQIWRQMM